MAQADRFVPRHPRGVSRRELLHRPSDKQVGRSSGRRGLVSLDGQRVGLIEETRCGTRFTYDAEWLARPDATPVSVTLPLRAQPYDAPELHPFFENLLPEGWYLEIVSKKLKIDQRDAFGLLLGTCGDCAGAVEVRPLKSR